MKLLLTSRFGSTVAIALAFLISNGPASALHASDDFEYAVSLLDVQQQRPLFQVEDLVERLALRLKHSKNEAVRWEGRLIDALLLQFRAARASADRRTEMLGEAEAICSEFLQKNAQHVRRASCLKLISEIRMAFVRALLTGEEDDSPVLLEARKRAVAMVEGMLPQHKAAAEAAWKELDEIRLPDDPTAVYPPSLLNRLGAAIEKVVVADQAWLSTWLLLIEACPPGERRAREIGNLTRVCQERIDHEKLMDCDLACALYQYLKGRAFAFLPDEPKATEAWREALRLLPENVMEEAVAKTVDGLRAAILLCSVAAFFAAVSFSKIFFWVIGPMTGVAFSAVRVSGRALAVEIFPEEKIGEIFGLLGFLSNLAFIGLLIWGALVYVFSPLGLVKYRIALFALVAILLLGAKVLKGVPDGLNA